MKHLRNRLIQKTYKFIKICSDEYWRFIAFNYSIMQLTRQDMQKLLNFQSNRKQNTNKIMGTAGIF